MADQETRIVANDRVLFLNNPRAYRRGKILTAVVVVITTMMFLWNYLDARQAGRLPGKPPNFVSLFNLRADFEVNGLGPGRALSRAVSLLVTCALAGLLAFRAYHGGMLSTGLLMWLYATLLLPLALFACLLSLSFVLPARGGPRLDAADIQHVRTMLDNVGDTFAFLVVTAWAAFACWVLFVSKDARLYRQARRYEAAKARLAASEWPPRGRATDRPQTSR